MTQNTTHQIPRYPAHRPFTGAVHVAQPYRTYTITPRTLLMAGMAALIAIMLVLVGWLGSEVAALRKQAPTTQTASYQVQGGKTASTFNDGWNTALTDVQEAWRGNRAQVTRCLDAAPAAQLHQCLDAAQK